MKRVRHRHAGHRYVGGARDGAFRVAGFRAVEGRRFEADERGETETQCRSDAGGEDRAGGEGRGVQSGRAAVGHHAGRHQQQDRGLGGEQDRQYLRADGHTSVAECPDSGYRGDRDERPWHVEAESEQRVVYLHGKQPVEADLQRVVADQCEYGGGEPHRGTEPACDVGVERPRALHIPGHLGEADGEDGHDDARDEVAHRRADAADGDRERPEPGQDGQGGGRRDNEENDPSGGQGVAPQPVLATRPECIRGW